MKTEHLYCGFLDVLGFKNIINDWELAKKYYEKLVIGIFQNISKMNNDTTHEKVNWRIISDSIILTSENPRSLIIDIATLQYYSFMNGYWTRGGIAYGRHLEQESNNNFFVVSEALRDAYICESEIAKHARVIIHKSALSGIEKSLFNPTLAYSGSKLLVQSEDDLWFVNPFMFRPGGDDQFFATAITSRLEEHKNTKHFDKYLWVADLHNFISAPGHFYKHFNSYYLKERDYIESLEHLCSWNDIAKIELVHTWKYSDNFHKFYQPRMQIPLEITVSPYRNTFDKNVRELRNILANAISSDLENTNID